MFIDGPVMDFSEDFNNRSFSEIADRWGYSCDLAYGEDQDAPNFRGVIRDRRLYSGLQVCSCDMLSLRDGLRSGTLERSIMLVCGLSADIATYLLDNGREIRLGKGDIALLSASDSISLTEQSRCAKRSTLLVVRADPSSIMDPDLAQEVEMRTRATTVHTFIAGAHAIGLASSLFERPRNMLTDKLVAESCSLELLAYAFEGGNGQSRSEGIASSNDRARIARVCDYLIANLSQEHHLPGLAREAAMSLSTFKAKFAAVTGKTVFGFLTEKRLERALLGMEKEGWTVAQAAYYTGYRHPTSFSAAFRRHFGFSPRNRKAH